MWMGGADGEVLHLKQRMHLVDNGCDLRFERQLNPIICPLDVHLGCSLLETRQFFVVFVLKPREILNGTSAFVCLIAQVGLSTIMINLIDFLWWNQTQKR